MYYRRLICTPRCSAVIIVKAASMAKLAVVVAAPHGSSGWPLPVSTKPLAQRSQEISHLLSFWARPAWQTQQSPMRLSVCLSVCPSSTENKVLFVRCLCQWAVPPEMHDNEHSRPHLVSPI